jgi:hypothetical protein
MNRFRCACCGEWAPFPDDGGEALADAIIDADARGVFDDPSGCAFVCDPCGELIEAWEAEGQKKRPREGA